MDLKEFRIWYDNGIFLDFDAYSEYHAVQLFTELAVSLNWPRPRINDVEQINALPDLDLGLKRW